MKPGAAMGSSKTSPLKTYGLVDNKVQPDARMEAITTATGISCTGMCGAHLQPSSRLLRCREPCRLMCELDLSGGTKAVCRLIDSEGFVSRFTLACPNHTIIAGHSVCA